MSEPRQPDRYRRRYRQLNDVELLQLDDLKAAAEALAEHLEQIDGREGSIARTKLDECVMWATKGITS